MEQSAKIKYIQKTGEIACLSLSPVVHRFGRNVAAILMVVLVNVTQTGVERCVPLDYTYFPNAIFAILHNSLALALALHIYSHTAESESFPLCFLKCFR